MMDVKSYRGLFYNEGLFSTVEDVLAVEEALSISINDIPFTITMRSPGNEKELVRGLLLSEGIFKDTALDPDIQITATNGKGYVTSVNVVIPDWLLLKDFSGSRNMMSVSSCGICGKKTWDEEMDTIQLKKSGVIDPGWVALMFERMSDQQKAFTQSGGTHAAAAFTLEGELLVIREDIGRHNAVDKVIGALLLNKKSDSAGFLTVSGRISYEIVSKAALAGIPVLASVSAPSSLAVDSAEKCGMTLLAFCRKKKLTVYSHPERVLQKQIV
jgi:FdhD protein